MGFSENEKNRYKYAAIYFIEAAIFLNKLQLRVLVWPHTEGELSITLLLSIGKSYLEL